MLYDRDKRFLEELSILVSRKIDYLLCFEKTYMSSIRSFTIGFLFSDTHYYSKHPKTIVRRSKEPYSLSSKFKHLHSIEEECPACSINDYLTDFIMQREIEKGKTKYCEQSYYNTITYFSNSNEEARDIFAQYLEEFKEYIKTADLWLESEKEEMDICEMINAIRNAPAMFTIGGESLESMSMAIYGFCRRYPKAQAKMNRFQEYIDKQYSDEFTKGWRWDKVIMYTVLNDAGAVHEFLKLWDEFIITDKSTVYTCLH